MASEYRIFRGVASPPEGVTRTIRVYQPNAKPSSKFRLLLMSDGQNLLDLDHDPGVIPWGVDKIIEQETGRNHQPPWLLVAVDHRGTERIGDHSPWSDSRLHFEARGQAQAAFLVEHVIPWARTALPVFSEATHTAIAGSSLGGLLALYVAWRYPEVVGRVAALSPSVMWSSRQLFRYWSRRPELPQRIYLDAGSRERFDAGAFSLEYGLAVREFHAHLRAVGYGEDELRLVLDPRGQHREADWRHRFPAALRWLAAGQGMGSTSEDDVDETQ